MLLPPFLLHRNSHAQRSQDARAGRAEPRQGRLAARLRIEPLEDRMAPAGLVAYWPAEGNANDVVGGHNGVLLNGLYGPGFQGTDRAFLLNGRNGYVRVPDAPAWNFGANAFTISLWAKFSGLKPDDIYHPQAVFIGHDEGGGNTNKWFFGYGGGALNFQTNIPSAGAAFLAVAPFSPVLGKWYNLVVSHSGGAYGIFVNGVLASAVRTPLAVPDASAPLTIGQAEGLGFMNGSIDDVKIWNQAFTTSAVKASPNPAVVGQAVTFTATVSVNPLGTDTPTGMVVFKDGTHVLGMGTLNSVGQATFSTASLAIGTHAIRAVYGGNASFIASTSIAYVQTVNALTAAAARVALETSATNDAALSGATAPLPVAQERLPATQQAAANPLGVFRPTGVNAPGVDAFFATQEHGARRPAVLASKPAVRASIDDAWNSFFG